MNPLELPVYQQKDRILSALADHRVVVVESPTGSGKTTQLPQILYEAGYGRDGVIGVTQPRRIAAVSVSRFIARQMNKTIPDTIGYKMRFEDQTDLSTRIKIMTDGILLQELKADYSLSRYSVMMVDEAHERSLNIDFILGLLKRVLALREDFKVIVSSATINAEVFSEYFDECPVVKIDTVTYPVHTIYNPPDVPGDYESILLRIVQIVDQTAESKDKGDILIFLPGERAIKDCVSRLQALRTAKKLKVLPLYGRLSAQEQEQVFDEFKGLRKIIVATNIAETSITIDGVTLIIDPGQAKLNFYNQRTFTSSLIEVPVSKASSNQRKGRAGRTSPGFCYRLYTRKEYEIRSLFTTEEILRTDLSEVVLRMAELDIRDFEGFDFISPPPRDGVVSAIETLRLLGAIDDDRALTSVGQMMCRFPLAPKHSRMIVEAIMVYPQVLEEVIIAASFLSSNNPFLLPQGEEMAARQAHHQFRDPYGDFLSYLKILKAYTSSTNKLKFCDSAYLDSQVMAQIANIKLQLEEIVSEMGIPISAHGDVADYLCAISRGLIQFVCAQVKKGVYRSPTEGRIMIHPGSVMWGETPSFIVAGEIVRTTRMYARSVSKLRGDWLLRISKELHGQLVLQSKKGKGDTTRDFTNQVRIGSGTFSVSTVKGKKSVVQMPWSQLNEALQELDRSQLGRYRKMRGTILYGEYEIMTDTGLETIFTAAPFLDPEKGLVDQWPPHNFTIPESADELCSELGNLMLLSRRSKKSKKLGFLTLQGDGTGTYWFKTARSFFSALTQSIANLENLIDEMASTSDHRAVERINQAYRRLTMMLEQ